MRRVGTNAMNNDMQYWLRRTEDKMASIQTKMATKERIENLRDDPLGAARAVRYESVVSRLSRYEDNIQYTKDRANLAEGYMRQTQDIMQRIREIAITGATGTFSKENTQAMAIEVDELLSEMVSLANSKGPDGDYLFAGSKAKTEPFRAVKGFVAEAGNPTTTQIDYLGGIGSPEAEISEGTYVPMNLAGDEVFWGERQRISSANDARNYRVLENSSIYINNHEIPLNAGDTVQAIIAKINNSGVAVKASLDPVKSSLVIEGNDARRLQIEDGAETNVLVDLGILSGSRVPSDFARTATSTGGSLFDTVMALRDSLYKGDHLDVGGRVLVGIDSAMDNMNRRLAQSGAIVERLSSAQLRMNKEIPDTTKLLSTEKDLDITEAITEYKMLDFAHTSTLQMGGKLLTKTLLDYLK